MKSPVRIFIADDHQLLLDGLATFIQSIEGFVLIGKFNSGKAILDALEKENHLPDICIVDIEMPEMDGIETVKTIRQHFPAIKTMILTMHDEFHFINRAIVAGADGYVLKNVDRDVFEKSIHRILNNDSFFTVGIEREDSNVRVPEHLSVRERQILRLIVEGKNNKEIAEELFISDRTADTHRTNIKRKLKMSSLSQLIHYAKERSLV